MIGAEPVRACVIGVGRVGAQHARLLGRLHGARLIGVHDRNRGRGEAVARRLGTRHDERPERLLEDAEAVVVAVPTRSHHQVCRAALLAGCHVLVEKPLAATLAEADELIALAAGRGLRLCVGHVERFNAAVRGFGPFLDRPRFIESLRLAPYQPRGTDVTVVLDLMIHDIDLVLGLVRERVASLSAAGVAVLSSSPDIANARLVFEGGAVADITASRVSERRRRELRLFQPSGYLRLDLRAGRGEFLRRRNGGGTVSAARGADAGTLPRDAEGGVVGTGAGSGSVAGTSRRNGLRRLEDVIERIPLESDGREPLELELQAFLRAARGEETGVVSGREAREALEIALRITREIEEFARCR